MPTDGARRRGAEGRIWTAMLVTIAFTAACDDGLTGMPSGDTRDPGGEFTSISETHPIYARGGLGAVKGKGGNKPTKTNPAPDSTTTDGSGDSGGTAGEPAPLPAPEPAPEPAPVTQVTVTPSSVSLTQGATQQLSVKLYDGSGTELTGRSVSWSTSNSVVVTVSSSGLVSAAGVGSASIKATSDGANGTAAISVTAPSGPTTAIYPGEDIQAKVNAHPSGTSFTLKAGVHRLQQITPKSGMTFVGEPGAVLNGARHLTSFTRSGSYWVASSLAGNSSPHGSCRSDSPRCGYVNDLFINDVPLKHVASLSAVTAGRWFFDYGAQKVYFADDPTGKKVEVSLTRHAFTGSASNVTIRGLTIEKYANPAQSGTVNATTGSDWVVENNVVRLNHGLAIRIGHRAQIRGNKVLRNGQMGVGGVGDDALVEGNEIAYNNFAGYAWGWEAGGTKFVRTNRLIVRNNHSHDNEGPGLWSDIDNYHVLYENNRVEDNTGPGIFHEISFNAVIRGNTIRRNGFSHPSWLWGAGILIAGSSNVEVVGNVVENNANGITAVQQKRLENGKDYKLRNVRVHGNAITMGRGMSGVAADDGDAGVFSSSGGNRFDGNRYYIGTTTSNWWAWSGAARSWSVWRGYGQDPVGSVAQ